MAGVNENDQSETLETVQASAGPAQRPSPLEALIVEPEPSPAELDARQAEMGQLRRSGPPLAEGEEAVVAGLEAVEVEEEPTEAAEPRRKDR